MALSPFAADPASAVRQIDVRIVRPAPAQLLLEYELRGDLARVRIAGSDAADDLWRHTCMEVFVGTAAAGPYLEFNFAPDGRWAGFRFSGYRASMAPLTAIRSPRIELRTGSDRLLLSADVALPSELAAARLRLGITAVVENTDRQLEYWALRHCGARPDFHHPDSFGFEI